MVRYHGEYGCSDVLELVDLVGYFESGQAPVASETWAEIAVGWKIRFGGASTSR